MKTINCKTCSKPIKVFPYQLRKSGKNPPRRFCSYKCYLCWRKEFYTPSEICRKKISKSLIGNTHGFQKGVKPWIAGKKNIWAFAEKNVNWKGKAVGYHALHSRIRRRKGSPKSCEKCNKSHPRIHLSNKSGKYLTDISDWMYLCPKCHRIFDLANGMGRKGLRNKKLPNKVI